MGFLMAHLIGFPFLKGILPHTGVGQKFTVKGGKKVFFGNTELFTMGSGGFGGGGGGFSDGGGFSGGGGSFGGGGASGDW